LIDFELLIIIGVKIAKIYNPPNPPNPAPILKLFSETLSYRETFILGAGLGGLGGFTFSTTLLNLLTFTFLPS